MHLSLILDNLFLFSLRSEHISEDEGLMKKYVYFGYGFPIFVVILSNLGAHMKKLYTNFEFELACYKHRKY